MSKTHFIARSPKELFEMMFRHAKNREARIRGAMQKAAKNGRNVIARAVPVAFQELRDSVHDEDTKIITDAPHAAAVNLGSRPHWMPLEPLIRWVKLRGMQGLDKHGELRTKGFKRGPTTRKHAMAVAAELKGLEAGGALGVDAPAQIARRIQIAIAQRGTKPTHFIERSLPRIGKALSTELIRALDSAVE